MVLQDVTNKIVNENVFIEEDLNDFNWYIYNYPNFLNKEKNKRAFICDNNTKISISLPINETNDKFIDLTLRGDITINELLLKLYNFYNEDYLSYKVHSIGSSTKQINPINLLGSNIKYSGFYKTPYSIYLILESINV